MTGEFLEGQRGDRGDKGTDSELRRRTSVRLLNSESVPLSPLKCPLISPVPIKDFPQTHDAQTSSLKTFFALSSKIIFFSAALSQSKPSIMWRVSSSHFPVFGSLTVPTPGRSVPNKQRSAPTVLKSSSKAPAEYSTVSNHSFRS